MRKKTLLSTLLFLIVLSGCNVFDRSYASLDHVYSTDGKQNYYSLSITKRTNELAMGHSGPHFVLLCHSFKLATKPKGRATYPITKITLKRDFLPESFPGLASGQIVVDLSSRLVYVSLETREGDFEGNGEYRLKYIPTCEHFRNDADSPP